ncbi:MAG: M20/M25/M40 family metallo-hydrolase, partial [Alphaproteobacteria bacterium]
MAETAPSSSAPGDASPAGRSLLAQASDAWVSEAVAHLQAMLRMRTVNPPGDESVVIDHVAAALRSAGLEPRVFEVAHGRANLVCRIAGRGPEGPLLLASHADVVEVEAASWRRDPFGGEIADGCVWGRGAVDMKGKIAMDLAA